MPVAPPSSIPPAGPPVAERLHTETIGAGRPVVLAHGFTQTGRVWGSLDGRLAATHRVVRVDLPGHGRSNGVRATLAGGARLLAAAGGRAAYLGYSMGARFCLQLALARPGAVERLVLISGTAGIEDPEERRARRRTDAALADELDPADGGSPAVTAESFVRHWLENPMFAGLDPAAAGLEERLTNTGAGLGLELAPGRYGHPAAALGRPPPAAHARPDHHRRPRREILRPRTADGPLDRAQCRGTGWSTTPATPLISSGPSRWPTWSRVHLDRPDPG